MSRPFCLLALILVALAPGCSTPFRSGYLESQSRMKHGEYVDGLWCSDAIAGQHVARVEITSVEARGIEDHASVSAALATSWLREHLDAVRNPGTPDGVFLSLSPKGPVAHLEVVLSEMTPGNAIARFWAAEFGAGHAYVQVEAKLSDPKSGARLCEMVQRTRGSGAIGFEDFGGDAGPRIVKRMLGMIARAFHDELENLLR